MFKAESDIASAALTFKGSGAVRVNGNGSAVSLFGLRSRFPALDGLAWTLGPTIPPDAPSIFKAAS
jgi:hypothetical protein